MAELLEPLVSTVKTIKERIATHGASLRENETRTRMALIDPLLQALGWDTSDLGMVLPEYDVSGRKADYALLQEDGNPAATIEAKRLGEQLTSHRMQMLNYSNASGVEYAGLTDGDKWELYEVFKRGQLEDRRILDISIANMAVHEAALKLLLLWRPNLASGQPMLANESVVGVAMDGPLLELGSSESVDDTLSDSGFWVSLALVKPSEYPEPPSAIRFSGRESYPVSRWQDVVVRILEYLIKDGSFSEQNCPWVTHGYTRVNTVPSRRDGQPFRAPQQVASGIYIETSGNRGHLIDRSRNLWNTFGNEDRLPELRF